MTEAISEFDHLGDLYQSYLAQHFKALLLTYKDGNTTLAEPFAICQRLEAEARARNYQALLLRVKSQQQSLIDYYPANRPDDWREIETLANQVNDQNSRYSIISQNSSKQAGYELIAQGIKLVTTKELENKDRQNIYNKLSHELLKSKYVGKLAAIESSSEANLIAISTNIRLVAAQGWRKLGESYSNTGAYPQAQEYFEKALWENEQAINAMIMTAVDYLALAELALKKKDYASSIKYFELVFQNSQRKFSPASELTARINWGKALIRSGNKERSVQALIEVQELFEKSKIEAADLPALKESLKRTFVEYYLKLENDPRKALVVYAGVEPEIHRMVNSTESITDGITQLQNSLEPDSQKIVFMVGEEETAVWVLSNNHCEYFLLKIGKDELGGKIDKLRELKSAKRSNENQSKALILSQELYSKIIQPLDQSLVMGSKLLFFSDQSLKLLPYSTLVSLVSGKLLIQDHQIQEVSSLRARDERVEPVAAGTDRFVGISNPVFDRSKNPGLHSLDSADVEVSNIATLFTNRLTLKGNEASFSQVVSSFKQAQVVHLSAHSVLDETDPWNSRVLLSKGKAGEGDTLSAATIRRMNLSNIKLASLSSCSSVGLLGDDGNATGLARAFIDAGVPIVVASLWDIDSKQSSEFMTRFYQYYAAGNSPARSLQLTQLESLSANQMSSSFSIGSAFVVISRN